MKASVIIMIILCIFCLLPSIGLGLFAIFDDDEDNGSCVSPIDEKYDFSNASGSYKIDSFKITGIECKDGYSGSVTVTKCNASGSPYNVSGCIADSKCTSTFPVPTDNTYTLIEGEDIANYDKISLKTLNPGKNCSGTGDNVSCNWDINASGVINCSEPSASGTIFCNSSGIFDLRNCSGVPVPPAAGGGGAGSSSEVPVPPAAGGGGAGSSSEVPVPPAAGGGGAGSSSEVPVPPTVICTNDGNGNSYTCSAGKVLKSDAVSIAGWTDDLCCDVATCDIHTCTYGNALKSDAENINGATDDLCCDVPTCDSGHCSVPGYTYIGETLVTSGVELCIPPDCDDDGDDWWCGSKPCIARERSEIQGPVFRSSGSTTASETCNTNFRGGIWGTHPNPPRTSASTDTSVMMTKCSISPNDPIASNWRYVKSDASTADEDRSGVPRVRLDFYERCCKAAP